MLKIAICEDNKALLNSIVTLINKILFKNNLDAEIIVASTNVSKFESFIENVHVDIFFLDINLNGEKTGFELAKKIREKNLLSYIVFITGHFEYILQAFKVQSFDYLVKPVNYESLEDCIKRMFLHYKESTSNELRDSKQIEIKFNSKMYRLKQKDIIFIEKLNRKTFIHSTKSKITCTKSLNSLEKILCNNTFKRCHKSFIVNKKFIDEIDNKDKVIKFNTGQECSFGRKYLNNLLEN